MMLQSLGPRGSPKLQPPLLPQGRASPGQVVFSGPSPRAPLRRGQWKGKGMGERRGKTKGEWVCGRVWREAAPQRTSSTPTQAPAVVTSPPSLWAPRLAQQLLREGMHRVRQEAAEWAWGRFLSPQTFLGPFKTGVPALSRCRNHVGAGAGWGGVGPTTVEIEAPVRQDKERVKIFGLGSSGVHPVVWYLHGSPRTEVAWGLGRSSGFPGMSCPSPPLPAPASACEDQAKPNRKHSL